MTSSQKEALAVLVYAEQCHEEAPEYDRVARLSNKNRRERPWNITVHAATARNLERQGLVHTFVRQIFLMGHEEFCELTPKGREVATQNTDSTERGT